ncbi:hypothetical protein [Bauldia litoralis]|uniref:hypothetical protein n=1 Tax=Bauldia litoralis TaxID=665467 RepID=UPI0032641863
MQTNTIVPATPDWRLCLPATGFGQRGRHIQVDIIAWQLDSTGNPTPVTAFGPADISEGYVVASPSGFAVLPNGPILLDYNEVSAFLDQKRKAAA